MPRLDAPEIDVNPAAFAPNAPEVAAGAGGPACEMAKLNYKTALVARILFTLLVLVVSTAAAASLVWAIYKIANDGADFGAIVLGVSGVVESGAAIFLVKRMTESITAANTALDKVGEFCGAGVKEAIENL